MTDEDRIRDEGAGAGEQPAPATPGSRGGHGGHATHGSHAPRVVDKRRAAEAGEAPRAEGQDEEIDRGSEELKAALDAARAEAAGYLDDLRRLKADFENYRKRVLKEQTALVETASAALTERLLPVLDNFELALIAADRTKDYEALVRGVELVFSEFKEVLKKQGLRPIDAHGVTFDPELHEAVMQEEGPEDGKPVVAEVFRTGYTLNGKVVRPAMVKVRRE